jgi:malate-CoA ligase subunit beta
LNIHEYQAKEILTEYGIKIAEGGLAYSVEEAVQRVREIEGETWVVKAQIHAGARGKAGGIKVCNSHAEVEAAAEALLGKELVTHQTGPSGKMCSRLYIEAGTKIVKEVYLSFLIDRSTERVIMIGSSQGGMEIETLAKTDPEKIKKIYIEPAVGLQDFQARTMAFALNLDASILNHAVKTIKGCYRALRDLDANTVEINPLVVTDTKAGKQPPILINQKRINK